MTEDLKIDNNWVHPASLIKVRPELLEKLTKQILSHSHAGNYDWSYSLAELIAQDAILYKEVILEIIEAAIEDGF